jgi:hypothetical protein
VTPAPTQSGRWRVGDRAWLKRGRWACCPKVPPQDAAPGRPRPSPGAEAQPPAGEGAALDPVRKRTTGRLSAASGPCPPIDPNAPPIGPTVSPRSSASTAPACALMSQILRKGLRSPRRRDGTVISGVSFGCLPPCGNAARSARRSSGDRRFGQLFASLRRAAWPAPTALCRSGEIGRRGATLRIAASVAAGAGQEALRGPRRRSTTAGSTRARASAPAKPPRSRRSSPSGWRRS